MKFKYNDTIIYLENGRKLVVERNNFKYEFFLDSNIILISKNDEIFQITFTEFINLGLSAGTYVCHRVVDSKGNFRYKEYEISFIEDGITIRHLKSPWRVSFVKLFVEMNFIMLYHIKLHDIYYISENLLFEGIRLEAR